jgi:radical SAM superfamily enzyme YgiQ (UPF0313 family)
MPPKQKILLLFPSIFYFPQDIERVEIKSSLLYIYSFLKPHFEVQIVDLETEIGRPNSRATIRRFKEKAKVFLSQIDFDTVGISCWTSLSYQAALSVGSILKEINPQATLIVGGYHPSAVPEDFMFSDSPFDFVVIGEGEEAFLKICSGEIKKQDKTTKVFGGSANLEELPFLDLSQITNKKNEMGRYPYPFYVYLSRDCPFSCNFCMEAAKRNRGWREMSPDKAIDQIQRIVDELKPYSLALADACFGINPKWRKEFLGKFKEKNYDFWVSIETHPNLLDNEDADLLSGLKVEVQFGLESGSPKMLEIMHKVNNPVKYLEYFKELSLNLSRKKVLHRANLIFNHPGETHQTVMETIDFMKKMMESGNSYLFWAIGDYSHFPGSQIDSNLDYYENTFGTQIAHPQWWKLEEDQWETCRKVLPSRDFTWEDKDFWQLRVQEIDELLKNSLSKEAFDHVAQRYRFDWR